MVNRMNNIFFSLFFFLIRFLKKKDPISIFFLFIASKYFLNALIVFLTFIGFFFILSSFFNFGDSFLSLSCILGILLKLNANELVKVLCKKKTKKECSIFSAGRSFKCIHWERQIKVYRFRRFLCSFFCDASLRKVIFGEIIQEM